MFILYLVLSALKGSLKVISRWQPVYVHEEFFNFRIFISNVIVWNYSYMNISESSCGVSCVCRVGGEKVLLLSAAAWGSMTAFTPILAHFCSQPILSMTVARFLMGLLQGEKDGFWKSDLQPEISVNRWGETPNLFRLSALFQTVKMCLGTWKRKFLIKCLSFVTFFFYHIKPVKKTSRS